MHFLLFSIPLAFLAVPSQSWAVSLGRGSEELVSCLQSSLSPQGSVVAPGYSLFMNDTRRFSTLNVPSFKVVSRVSNEEDVRASVRSAGFSIAKFTDLLTMARSLVRRTRELLSCSPAPAMAITQASQSYRTDWRYSLPPSMRSSLIPDPIP